MYDAHIYAYDASSRHALLNVQVRSKSHKFIDKERDGKSGLDNFGARYFASTLGRFSSPDPGNASGFENIDDPQSWNGYAYARKNPLLYIDPDGLNYVVCDAEVRTVLIYRTRSTRNSGKTAQISTRRRAGTSTQ